MRALVTGCAGFIGSHLTESLLADGCDVVGVDCFNDNYGRPQKLRHLEAARDWHAFDFVPLDLAQGSVADLVEGIDVVFHLAAEPGVRSSWGGRFESYLRNNVKATQQLLEALAGQEGTRLVYASSSSVYGDAEALPTSEDAEPRPLSPYGMTKLSAEHLCQIYAANHGVRHVTLRYFSVYGPRQRPDMAFNLFCRAALQGEPITVFGDGRQTRDFTFVDDVVAATRAAATAPEAVGRTYNVGGSSRVGLADALALLEEFLGRPLEIRHADRERGDAKDTAADIARARSDLGYTPSTDFPTGLRAEFDWMASELGVAAASRDPAPGANGGPPEAAHEPAGLATLPRATRTRWRRWLKRLHIELAPGEHPEHVASAAGSKGRGLLAATRHRLLLAGPGDGCREIPYRSVLSVRLRPRSRRGAQLHIVSTAEEIVAKGRHAELMPLEAFLRDRIWEARPREASGRN
jgi:UDP-glucuronate 4-epimerase